MIEIPLWAAFVLVGIGAIALFLLVVAIVIIVIAARKGAKRRRERLEAEKS
jgi:integral membrane sensor domain MASE1